MAVTAISGNTADDRGTTYAVDSQRLVIDMKDKIELLEPGVAPLTTMLSHPSIGSRDAKATKVEWPESEILPPITAAALGATAGSDTATSIAVATGTGIYFRGNDLVRNEATGETFRVNTTSGDTLNSVTRGIGAGGTGIIFSTTTDKLVRLSNASSSGGTMPTIVMTKTVFNYNYCQIQRDGLGAVNDAAEAKMYGGPYLDVERAKKLIEHEAAKERQLFFGKRDFKTDATIFGGTTRPQYIAGGLVGQYCTANIKTVGGNLTTTNLLDGLRPIFRYGSSEKLGFCSPLFYDAIASFSIAKGGLGTWSEISNQYGVPARRVTTGAGGDLILVCKKDWLDYPTASPGAGGMMVVIDPKYVRLVNYRSRANLKDRQQPSADEQQEEFLSQFSLEVVLGGSSGGSGNSPHGIIRGVTGF